MFGMDSRQSEKFWNDVIGDEEDEIPLMALAIGLVLFPFVLAGCFVYDLVTRFKSKNNLQDKEEQDGWR